MGFYIFKYGKKIHTTTCEWVKNNRDSENLIFTNTNRAIQGRGSCQLCFGPLMEQYKKEWS